MTVQASRPFRGPGPCRFASNISRRQPNDDSIANHHNNNNNSNNHNNTNKYNNEYNNDINNDNTNDTNNNI